MKFRERYVRDLNHNSELSNKLISLNKIESSYGTYHKTVVHFHSPASHDYKVNINGKDKRMKQVTEKEAESIAEKNSLYKFTGIDKNYIKGLVKKNVFPSYREGIFYLLMAQCLIIKKIELAVITDHNTIDGYERLNSAVNIIKRYRDNSFVPFIQLGVEVSCGDKLHVVGIFDNTEEMENQVKEVLNEILVSAGEGSYLASWQVIEKFKDLGGIAYVAHLNAENIFKSDNYGSGAYKKKLFSKENMSIVGLSKLTKKEYLLNKLIIDKKLNNIVILYDEDSHKLEDLGEKFFWIKGQKESFDLFTNAIHDSDIAIKLEEPSLPGVYIKHISIEGNGFLGGRNEKSLNLDFSTSLNCIIGGRGTGKSTLLDCINFVLSQNVINTAQLKNICNQGTIWLTVTLDDEDYFIKFNPLTDNLDETLFLQGYLHGKEHEFQYGPNGKKFNKNEVSKATLEKIQIFKIEGNAVFEITEKKNFFNYIFKESYSINELVKNASDNEIQSFIRKQLAFSKNPLPKLKNIKINNDSKLEEAYNRLYEKMSIHKDKVLASINSINDKRSNTRIVYKQLPFSDFVFNWENVLKSTSHLLKKEILRKYNISFSEIENFLSEGASTYNVIGFYLMFKNEKYKDLSSILINVISNKHGVKEIDQGKQKIDENNIVNLLKEIGAIIINAAKIDIYNFINKYQSIADILDLEFDINSYESGNDNGEIFKSISQISLGQKVVALLDFIFIFKDITNDSTPLLLDQPEDNLDSSYI